jgi:hypothetical protein
MDPFTAPIKRSTLHEGRHIFSEAEVIEFIDSFDFPDIEITSEVATLGDEINSEPFVKSFFEASASVIVKRSPPKMSPKKLIENCARLNTKVLSEARIPNALVARSPELS